MAEMHLKQSGFTYSACGPFTKENKEFKNFCKQEIQILFTKMNWIRLIFNLIWFMENTKIKSDYLTAFQNILENSKRKPNKIWTNQGSEFYNTNFKKWFKDNNIEMYSTHNEGKSVVSERFIRTLKNKI